MELKSEIINVIKENLFGILPELDKERVSNDDSFVDLGANSVDRAELLMLTLERLNVEVSRIEFVSAQTINHLADLIMKKRQDSNLRK